MIEPGNMIEQWLQSLGLAQHAAAFKAAAIDLDILTDLTEADLQGLGLPLGDRKRIVRAASALRRQVPEPPAAVGPSAALRRHLTVLFCDLVASSALSASLDPEGLHRGAEQGARREPIGGRGAWRQHRSLRR